MKFIFIFFLFFSFSSALDFSIAHADIINRNENNKTEKDSSYKYSIPIVSERITFPSLKAYEVIMNSFVEKIKLKNLSLENSKTLNAHLIEEVSPFVLDSILQLYKTTIYLNSLDQQTEEMNKLWEAQGGIHSVELLASESSDLDLGKLSKEDLKKELSKRDEQRKKEVQSEMKIFDDTTEKIERSLSYILHGLRITTEILDQLSIENHEIKKAFLPYLLVDKKIPLYNSSHLEMLCDNSPFSSFIGGQNLDEDKTSSNPCKKIKEVSLSQALQFLKNPIRKQRVLKTLEEIRASSYTLPSGVKTSLFNLNIIDQETKEKDFSTDLCGLLKSKELKDSLLAGARQYLKIGSEPSSIRCPLVSLKFQKKKRATMKEKNSFKKRILLSEEIEPLSADEGLSYVKYYNFKGEKVYYELTKEDLEQILFSLDQLEN